jgi:hypothetical protein
MVFVTSYAAAGNMAVVESFVNLYCTVFSWAGLFIAIYYPLYDTPLQERCDVNQV